MRILTIACLIISAFPSFGEIEKLAIPSDEGFNFYWWPKVVVPKGWHHEREASLNYSANMMAPNGSNISNADTVIYARAVYKPRRPEIENLKDLITSDHEDFEKNTHGIRIEKIESLKDGDNRMLVAYRFKPKSSGNWEIVCYGEEKEFFLVFTISSRSETGLNENLPDFKKLISNYKEVQQVAGGDHPR